MPRILESIDLIRIPGQSCDVGWRFDHLYEQDDDDPIVYLLDTEKHFSPARTVTTEPFLIGRTTVPLAELIPAESVDFAEVHTPEDVCKFVNNALKREGYRLPTEDEFEVAFGGGNYPWGGDVVPKESPDFLQRCHADVEPGVNGLVFNLSDRRCELVSVAKKLGDGGASTCGGYGDHWLPFCPAFRCKFYRISKDWNSLDIRVVRI